MVGCWFAIDDDSSGIAKKKKKLVPAAAAQPGAMVGQLAVSSSDDMAWTRVGAAAGSQLVVSSCLMTAV